MAFLSICFHFVSYLQRTYYRLAFNLFPPLGKCWIYPSIVSHWEEDKDCGRYSSFVREENVRVVHWTVESAVQKRLFGRPWCRWGDNFKQNLCAGINRNALSSKLSVRMAPSGDTGTGSSVPAPRDSFMQIYGSSQQSHSAAETRLEICSRQVP
jgi:hypothetical protein